MAGLEQLEVHSKSYLVRWIRVPEGNTISWSLQPQKKSINFGLFKRPDDANSSATKLPASRISTLEPLRARTPDTNGNSNHAGKPATLRRLSSSAAKEEFTSVGEKLTKLGYKEVVQLARCEGDRVSLGHFDVPKGGSGNYGLVFDNTYSKQLSKTITFVLMTYPTNAPPKSGSHIRYGLQRKTSGNTIISPGLEPISDSDEYLPQLSGVSKRSAVDPYSPSRRAPDAFTAPNTFYAGTLSKKRRKKGQGYARRFFSLDFTTSTLSYYKSRESSALRGAIPLSLAVLGVNEDARQFSVDSGTEVWLLKAQNTKEFEAWRPLLEKASRTASVPLLQLPKRNSRQVPTRSAEEEDREWENVESLVAKVAGITDGMRRLARDADPKYSSVYALPGDGRPSIAINQATTSPPDMDNGGDYFQGEETSGGRKRFWNRSSSTNGRSSSSTSVRKSIIPSQPPNGLSPPTATSFPATYRHPAAQSAVQLPEEHVHERCMAVLRDLDTVVTQFSELISESRQRRMPELTPVITRLSIDSTTSADFFDAEDGGVRQSQILEIEKHSDMEISPNQSQPSEAEDSESTSDDEPAIDLENRSGQEQTSFFPSKPTSLSPLPQSSVVRRTIIPPSVAPPPSIISILRKNAGKDLSTLAMPVTTNEPLSLLQRQAEQLEYSSLLDTAVLADGPSGARLLHITAFALSYLSVNRVKERAVRKPFNPLLGETYELVREDRGFRFLAEKVSHRPVRVACQAESKTWTYTQAPSPDQKFWGKSAEITTDGRARVRLHGSGDQYSWSMPTCALRNIIGPGEKYIEPVQSMTVVEETSGRKAIATFKAGGMFAGRSEDVSVHVYEADGSQLPISLEGKWTEHLSLHHPSGGNPTEIWRVGTLIPNAPLHYGMTSFAATLNEITDLERGRLPPTDSRLRPDQRMYEQREVEAAEAEKVKLEEAQRRRRRDGEERGEGWRSRWFRQVNGAEGQGQEEVWVMRGGEYWEERETGVWGGVGRIFEGE